MGAMIVLGAVAFFLAVFLLPVLAGILPLRGKR